MSLVDGNWASSQNALTMSPSIVCCSSPRSILKIMSLTNCFLSAVVVLLAAILVVLEVIAAHLRNGIQQDAL